MYNKLMEKILDVLTAVAIAAILTACLLAYFGVL